MIAKVSARSVAETVPLLSEMVKRPDRTAWKRDTVVVIFGSPEAATPVMASAPLVALDLPLKVLTRADGAGRMSAMAGPATLAGRFR